MADSLAILPKNFGEQSKVPKKPEAQRFLPAQRGGLVLNSNEEQCPYTFSDSPAYTRQKKAEADAKRAAELEGRDETRGFLRNIEEHVRCQKWQLAYQALERRTAIPSGFFLVTRALLRWKFGQYAAALSDAENALQNYSAAKAGELAAGFLCLARICLGASPGSKRGECSKALQPLVDAWDAAEKAAVQSHTLNQGIFKPRVEVRLAEADEIVDKVVAHDGTYLAAPGVRIGYVLLKNQSDERVPVVLHFHGADETAADYREPGVAQRCRDIGMHLLVVDYRGYGWSSGQPSADTLLADAQPLAEALPKILVEHGLLYPCPGGLVLSGRAIGAQVAIHLNAVSGSFSRAIVVESAVAISSSGDRLGRAAPRAHALEQWTEELEKAGLGILGPLVADLWHLSALEKIKHFDGRLLVLHGLSDDTLPPEGSESLHSACPSKQKQLALLEGACRKSMLGLDEYWSALRTFLLKVQLDNALPSQEEEQHYCAVCAEKAASKCGRCGLVWYCGRQHQVDHWKAHKAACKPVEAKQPATEEACLVAILAVDLCTESDVVDLATCLHGLGSQKEPLFAMLASWRAATEDLQAAARESFSAFESKNPIVKVRAVEATSSCSRFEHVSAALAAHPLSEVPAHAWCSFPNARELWSPDYTKELLRLLRVDKPDKRNVAVRCTHFARPSSDAAAPTEADELACTSGGSTGSRARSCRDSEEVQAALDTGTAEFILDDQLRLEDIAVRAKELHSFVQEAPLTLLQADACWRRFVYKVTHVFGKRVLDLKPEGGQWLRWVPSRRWEDSAEESLRTEADACKGEELYERSEEAAVFNTPQEAIDAIAGLRRSLESRITPWAGEKLSAQELRTLVVESTDEFLQSTGLDALVGWRSWAREAATEIGNVAAQKLAVRVISQAAA